MQIIVQAVWLTEAALFDGWEWLTGKGRRHLRKALLVFSAAVCVLPLLFLVRDHTEFGKIAWVAAAKLFLLWARWTGRTDFATRPDEYLTNRWFVGAAAFCVWMEAVFFPLQLLFGHPEYAASGFSWLLLWLSDFVLWADHMNRPRKKRKPLPEHLRERFKEIARIPRPIMVPN